MASETGLAASETGLAANEVALAAKHSLKTPEESEEGWLRFVRWNMLPCQWARILA